MLVFFRERLAYLAVPKTGTTAIHRALEHRASLVLRDPPGLKHTNARSFERKFRGMLERNALRPIETVAAFREPIDWLGSWFRYRQRAALDGHANSTAGLSFDQFVEAYLSESQPPFAELGAQSRFVTDQQGELLVNHLYQYEDQSQLLRFFEDRLGMRISLERLNVSPEKELTLSPDLEAELRSTYPLDFQIYAAVSEAPLSVS